MTVLVSRAAANLASHFLKEQQDLPGAAQLSLVLFDHKYLVTQQALPITDVPPLDATSYEPRGTTRLGCAIGRTIDEALARHRRLSERERPDRVVMCILTDGLENASRDFHGERIREMITARRQGGWEFGFLAANQDAVTTARQFNIADGWGSDRYYFMPCP